MQPRNDVKESRTPGRNGKPLCSGFLFWEQAAARLVLQCHPFIYVNDHLLLILKGLPGCVKLFLQLFFIFSSRKSWYMLSIIGSVISLFNSKQDRGEKDEKKGLCCP
ncbi:MAG: hypothetical protein KJ814_09185 [Proteobacteria bacterium]|nr:hypothetical protein [Pseudomonadota bacterium]